LCLFFVLFAHSPGALQIPRYSVRDGLPSENDGSVFPRESGETWFAPISGGLYRLRDGVVTAVTEAGLAADVVYSIAGNNRDDAHRFRQEISSR
jgi:hypothetical protein